MAIGNPFGLDQTVTTGIVSAKERFIGSGPYDEFVQTDASINPGNSGGPLLDSRGAVVGINSAIFSQSGGSIGIGFAIPINLAKTVLLQLRDRGAVVRGYLGVAVRPITPEAAEAAGLKDQKGVLDRERRRGLPAEKAGHAERRRDRRRQRSGRRGAAGAHAAHRRDGARHEGGDLAHPKGEDAPAARGARPPARPPLTRRARRRARAGSGSGSMSPATDVTLTETFADLRRPRLRRGVHAVAGDGLRAAGHRPDLQGRGL